MRHLPVFLACLGLLSILGLTSCYVRGYGYELESEKHIRLSMNKDLTKVVHIDTILCRQALGAGEVFFDDMLWDNLSDTQRRLTADCLDTKRKLKVKALPSGGTDSVRVFTARVHMEDHKLRMGWIAKGCLTCDISEVLVEYRLQQDGAKLTAELVSEQEMWR